ncbi:MATE family efflux transporter [Aliikangiella coralliicola]|uniref:MATE family efflux transporter n=1 Tax=Aliikangiella coralliicola TaxID=2592383 RepID=A0A545UF51_9GAMM|nr:MATE family efflux transporter [Aliikangiella coralliicola]TQV88097.1 MATE family efflux transporter [Aliikangiella coralliicola]
MNTQFKILLAASIPIAIQTLLFSSKSIIDVFLLSDLGADNVSAIGIANRICTMICIFLVGVSTGGHYVTSQCTHEKNKLHSSTTLLLIVSLVFCLLICAGIYYANAYLIYLSTTKHEIIELTQSYLLVVNYMFLCLAICSVISGYLRILGHVKFVSSASVLGVLTNLIISYYLITDYDLGIMGAAYGTLFSAILETLLIALFLVYRKTAFFRLQGINIKQIRIILYQSLTSSAGSMLWAVGAFILHSLISSTSENSMYMMAIISPIESIALCFCLGLSIATSIEIGKSIGANDRRSTYEIAKASFFLSTLVTVSIVSALLIFENSVFELFSEQNLSRKFFHDFYLIAIFSIILKSFNIVLISGVIRSGGDANYCLKLDFLTQWLIAIPAAYLLGKMGYPGTSLLLVILVEEVIKSLFAYYRFLSDRWRTNLSHMF